MKLNYKKMAIGCAITLVGGVLFSFAIFPKILKSILKSQVVLKPGSQMRDMWSEIPFPLEFLIYVFNVTNPEEIIAGGKAKVQQVGPYYLEEWKQKYDQQDNAEDDTISFHLRNTFIFRPDKSNGLTGKETLVMANILFLSIPLVVQREREPMLPLVAKGLKEVFPNQTAFMKTTFLDMFWDGMPVDCTSQNFSAKALCSAFETDVKGMKPLNSTFYSFSLFGAGNHSDAGKFTVYRGIKNVRDLGRVVMFKDEPEMDVWGGDECNQYVGTDSTIFPPFLTKEDGLWAYTPDICRSMGAVFERKSSYAGLPALRYTLDLGDLKADEKLHCFCNDPPDGCPPKGTMDLFPCVGAPLIASMPHFYNADEKLLENVDGLHPTKEDHAVFIDFEIISGTPLSAAKRLQFNLDLGPVAIIDEMKDLREVILPIFWIQEGANLNKTYTNMLKYQLFLGLKFNAFVKYMSIIIGTVGTIAGSYLYFKRSKVIQTQEVSTVKTSALEHVNNGLDNDTDPPKTATTKGLGERVAY